MHSVWMLVVGNYYGQLFNFNGFQLNWAPDIFLRALAGGAPSERVLHLLTLR